jgi:deazaflavin-dependent oxidoreductase (nitroreductase family)
MRRRARFMRLVNIPMRRVLGLPFATPVSRRLMLLHLTGRKTGRGYRQPVSYVIDGDTLLSPGGGNWKRNLRDGEAVRVRLRGRARQASPELVRDPDEIERLLQKMVVANPRLTGFVPSVGRDGAIDRAELEAAATRGFCIVRWHFQTPTPGGRP